MPRKQSESMARARLFIVAQVSKTCCIADFQSAVSQASRLLGVRWELGFENFGATVRGYACRLEVGDTAGQRPALR